MREVTLYTGEEIYRPFWEEDSALLEVELGCNWYKCKKIKLVLDNQTQLLYSY